MEAPNYFVDLILPLPIDTFFTYHLEKKEFDLLEAGSLAVVPFGGKKLYSGLVYKKHNQAPTLYKTKPIYQILEQASMVTLKQLEFWKWLSEYYLTPIGLIYKQAIPSVFQLESQTYFSKVFNEKINESELSEGEFLILEAFELQSSLSIKEIEKIIDTKSCFLVLKTLLKKGLIKPREEVFEKYIPKKETYLFLHPSLEKNTNWEKIFESLTQKQKELLLGFLSFRNTSKKLITVKELLEKYGFSRAILDVLIKKNILELQALIKDRTLIYSKEKKISSSQELGLHQKKIHESIKSAFEKKEIIFFQQENLEDYYLIYIKLIEEALNKNLKVLFFISEVLLKLDFLEKLKNIFGKKIGLLHPKFNSQEKGEFYKNTLNNKYEILIGNQNALFLPIENLGLVIIEQEHEFREASFYNLTNSALIWAKINKAKTILSSPTPSLETYQNTKTQKYAFIAPKENFDSRKFPEIHLIDLKALHLKNQMQGTFSLELIKNIKKTLEEKKQVLLFQNKRGYAPILQCQNCGFSPNCVHCAIALSYHREKSALLCHYCGYKQAYPKFCFACKSLDLKLKGVGVEQIMEQAKKLFPSALIARMDSDSMKRKFSYEKLLGLFETKQIDILIGTQLIAKGAFSNVGLVGIMQADQMILRADFRAYEKAFQFFYQLSQNTKEKVFIQSFDPSHLVLQQLKIYDYKNLAEIILKTRSQFLYPPFCKLIKVELQDKNSAKLSRASINLASELKKYFGKNLLGPQSPNVEKIRGKYLKNMLIKIQLDPKSILDARNLIKNTLLSFNQIKAYKNIEINIKIDF